MAGNASADDDLKFVDANDPSIRDDAAAGAAPAPLGEMAPVPTQTLGQMGDGAPTWRNFICLSSNPGVAFFHLFFKAVALFVFLFYKLLGMNFETTFIVCTLSLAFDFWVVKNLSGRILVGLRWWNEQKEDGSSEWRFESHPDGREGVKPVDSRIFWTGLYAAPAIWLVAGILELLSLSFTWLLICAVGVALQGANVYGYIRCSRSQQQQLESAMQNGALSAFGGGVLGTVIAAAGGASRQAAAAPAEAQGASSGQAGAPSAPAGGPPAPSGSRFTGSADGLGEP